MSHQKNQRQIQFLCHYCHFFSHFYMLAFPSMALILKEQFNMTLGDTLSLGFFMYFLFGFTALPMGILSDVFNGRSFMIAFLLGIGSSAIFCGFTNSPSALAWGLAGIGLFASIYHPVGLSMLSKTSLNRGQTLGINGMFGNLGIGTAPIITGFLSLTMGWKSAFFLFGIPSVLYGIYMLFVPLDETPVHKKDTGTLSKRPKAELISLILILIGMVFLGFCYRGTVALAPATIKNHAADLHQIFQGLENQLSISTPKVLGATLLTSFIYFFGVFGQLYGGRLSDIYDLKKIYFLFHAITLPCMFALAYLTGIPLIIAFIIYVFFGLGMQPIENSLVARLTPPKYRGTVFGVKFIGVLGIGALAVKIIQWLEVHSHVRQQFLIQTIFIVLVLCILGTVLIITRKQRFTNK